jgi:hypothetical protein
VSVIQRTRLEWSWPFLVKAAAEPAVDANNVVVCHCSDAPARRHFAVKQIALTLGEAQK